MDYFTAGLFVAWQGFFRDFILFVNNKNFVKLLIELSPSKIFGASDDSLPQRSRLTLPQRDFLILDHDVLLEVLLPLRRLF